MERTNEIKQRRKQVYRGHLSRSALQRQSAQEKVLSQSQYIGLRPSSTMVNEREPPRTATAPQKLDAGHLAPPNAQHGLSGDGIKRMGPSTATPPQAKPAHRPLHDLTNNAPEFGKASPLRNPLKNDMHIFNIPKPGQRRAEHHKAPLPPSGHLPPSTAPGIAPYPDPRMPVPYFGPLPTHVGALAGKPAVRAQPDVVEISRPANFPVYTTNPVSRPIFSAFGNSAGVGFTPVNDFFGRPRTTVDLTKKDDDEFDPDEALKDDRFGAADAYAYVDAAQANDNIKALLEGAFDEEGDKPRTRRRKKKQGAAVNDLASKLQALEVKDEKVDGASAQDEEEVEDDGTVEGMNVKLLPHQVDGVDWMLAKEVGEKSKKGLLPKGGILADDVSCRERLPCSLLTIDRWVLERPSSPWH